MYTKKTICPRSGVVSMNGWQRTGHPRIIQNYPGVLVKTPVFTPDQGATGARISWGQLVQDV